MVIAPAAHTLASDTLTFDCSLVAYGLVEATPDELPSLREQPASTGGPSIPPRFLRKADEQTVVGLAAVLRALPDASLASEPLGAWGIVAAPRFPGRSLGAAAFNRFVQTGPATFSPHFIPSHSLHSVASAISVALGFHGPSFGVGGGPEAVAEGLMAALTFLDTGLMPGLWLVLTGWEPELVPSDVGTSASESVCRGIAFALMPGQAASARLRLTVARQGDFANARDNPLSLARIFAHFSDTSLRDLGPWSCALPCGSQIEIDTCAPALEERCPCLEQQQVGQS